MTSLEILSLKKKRAVKAKNEYIGTKKYIYNFICRSLISNFVSVVTILFIGISFVTTTLAPIMLFLPIVTLPNIFAPA